MGIRISGKYIGDKRVELLHEDSGAKIVTAAPKDNQGDGSLFSPTDLFASSLASCTLTIIAMAAEAEGISVEGSYFGVEKEMSKAPRRIGQLSLEIHLPKVLTSEQRIRLEKAGNGCPVHHSIHPDVVTNIVYLYDV